jgi:hypothetical protein
MTAFIGERGIQIKPWGHKDAGTGSDAFENGLIKVFTLGMRHRTSYLALFASNATLRIYKHCLHVGCLLL